MTLPCMVQNSMCCKSAARAADDLQATGDTRGARRRSSLSYEPSAAPHLNPLGHSTRERLSVRRREVAVAISIAI